MSLDLIIRVSFQLHGEQAVLQPFQRIWLMVHAVISYLVFFIPESIESCEGKVPCPWTQTSKQCTNVEGGEKCYISLKTAQQARSNHRTTSALLIQYMTWICPTVVNIFLCLTCPPDGNEVQFTHACSRLLYLFTTAVCMLLAGIY